MHLKNFLNHVGRLRAENRLLKFAVLVIGVLVCVNTVMLQKALTSQRTILVPPGLDTKVEVRGDQVDDQYVMHFARYVSALAFTFHQGNVQKQFEELLLLFAPEAYSSGKTTFHNLAAKVLETRLNQVFQIDKVSIDQDQKRIEVFGMRRQFIDDKRVDTVAITYILEYRISDGKFLLLSVSEAEPVAVSKAPPAADAAASKN